MARSLLFCFFVCSLILTLAEARPFAVMIHTSSTELHGHGLAEPPSTSFISVGGAPEMARIPKHHRPFDKSIAGAEVILGGLATAIFAAIFGYIRVTRQTVNEEEKS